MTPSRTSRSAKTPLHRLLLLPPCPAFIISRRLPHISRRCLRIILLAGSLHLATSFASQTLGRTSACTTHHPQLTANATISSALCLPQLRVILHQSSLPSICFQGRRLPLLIPRALVHCLSIGPPRPLCHVTTPLHLPTQFLLVFLQTQMRQISSSSCVLPEFPTGVGARSRH